MKKASRDLLQLITDANGTSGYEGRIAKIVAEQLAGVGPITYDNLGGIICEKVGDPAGPKVMLAGHMDEIGFMVKLVTKEGFVKFSTLGGWWDQVLLGQRVVIETSKGNIPGVIGSKPPHLLSGDERGKVVEIKSMFIDLGVKDKEAAEKLGVRPGDPIYPDSKFAVMADNKVMLAKAWDDRAGVALMIETLKAFQTVKHPNILYGVGTVQEEVGLRGAQTAVQSIAPDVGIVLETAIAGDMPGVTEDESNIKLGGGAVIYLLDGSMVPQLRLRDLVIDICATENLPYQISILERGGTDGGKIHVHARGVPSIVIGVPTRYIHAHAGMMHADDYVGALKLIAALCKRLDAKTVAKLTAR